MRLWLHMAGLEHRYCVGFDLNKADGFAILDYKIDSPNLLRSIGEPGLPKALSTQNFRQML